MKCWLVLVVVSLLSLQLPTTINAFSSLLPKNQNYCYCSKRIGCPTRSIISLSMSGDGPAGSFFNKVPNKDDDDDDGEKVPPQTPLGDMSSSNINPESLLSSKESGKKKESTSLGGMGFGVVNKKSKKPYVALGPPDKPINDVTKPQFDKDGYTLYENEKTGEKKRVFDALVNYPCKFPLKVVGANDPKFITDMVQLTADTCNVSSEDVSFSTKNKGKWVSITIQAPVVNPEMLYELYEVIGKDSRVKFKF